MSASTPPPKCTGIVSSLKISARKAGILKHHELPTAAAQVARPHAETRRGRTFFGVARIAEKESADSVAMQARVVLFASLMHFMAFAFKRAHYTSVRLGRQYAEKFGLTPARFDMLYAIRRDKNRSQAFLARTLGVAGVTVSRMLRKLETLGFVKRRGPEWPDRRVKRVQITKLGRRHLHLVLRKLSRWPMQYAFMRVLCYERGDSRFIALDDARSLVTNMTRRLGDGASLVYPTWHPDD